MGDVYPVTLAAFLSTLVGANTIKLALLSSSYVYSSGHDFYNDVSAALLGTPVTIVSPTYTAGVLDGTRPVAYSGVAALAVVTQAVVYIDTGVAGTSRVLVHIDRNADGSAISFTGDGNPINVDWPLGLLMSI